MSNIKVGSKLERQIEDLFNSHKFFIHFLEKKKDGSQPFDFFIVKNNEVYFFDAKHVEGKYFSTDRIELNQILSFEKLIRVGFKKENLGFFIYFEQANSYKILEFCRVFEKKTYKMEDLKEVIITDENIYR